MIDSKSGLEIKSGKISEAEKINRSYKKMFIYFGCVLSSFCFAGFSAFGELSPFGISFLCAVPFKMCFATIIGGVLGYFIALPFSVSAFYICGMVLCAVVRLFLGRRFAFFRKKEVKPWLSFLFSFVSCLTRELYDGTFLKGVFFSFVDGFLSLCMCFILMRTVDFMFTDKRGRGTVADRLFLLCSISLFALCGSSFTVKGIAVVRIAVFVMLMYSGLFFGNGHSGIFGIWEGAFLSLQPGFSHLFAVTSLGSLAAGLFSGYGQIFTALAFFCGSVIGCFYGGADREMWITLAEITVACGVFCLIPAGIGEKAEELVRRKGLVQDEKVNRNTAYILNRASENIFHICDLIAEVGRKMAAEKESDSEDPLLKLKSDEMQKVLTDQFSGIGEFLKELALQVNCTRIAEPSKAAALKTLLRERGIIPDMVGWYKNGRGDITVELVLVDRPFDIDWKKAGRIIETFSLRSFDRPTVEVTELKTVITYCQSLPYRLQIGYCQKPSRHGELCGDSVSAAVRTDCRGFAMISDGMGTGVAAAADSRMTAAVMKKLICSGFSFDSALKIVNSNLIARSGEESVASIDGIEIDLFSGKAVFYKAGASCSFVRKGDSIASLERASLPLGVIRDISFSKAEFTASQGDIILLVSDGVAQQYEDWIADELLSWSTNNMEELSMHILKLAHIRHKKEISDDMTVVAVKVEGRRKDKS